MKPAETSLRGLKEIMKNTLKFLLAAFCAISLFGCGGSDNPNEEPPMPSSKIPEEMVGDWKLTAWSDDADGAIVAGKIQVYVQFGKSGTFTLYQNFNAPGFTQFTGVFTYNDTNKSINGSYKTSAGSEAWGHSYTVSELSNTTMKLTASGTGDVATYTKTTIPTDLVTDGTKAAFDYDGYRFL